MPPKAYRWVDEMREIAETFHTEGGFEVRRFRSISYLFETKSESQDMLWEQKISLAPQSCLVTQGLGLRKQR